MIYNIAIPPSIKPVRNKFDINSSRTVPVFALTRRYCQSRKGQWYNQRPSLFYPAVVPRRLRPDTFNNTPIHHPVVQFYSKWRSHQSLRARNLLQFPHPLCILQVILQCPRYSQLMNIQLELYLDYVCPFSKKMFNTVYTSVFPLIKKKYPDKVQIIFRQQIQPWHPSSTIVHEAGVAVLKIQPSRFWEFSKVRSRSCLFKAQHLTAYTGSLRRLRILLRHEHRQRDTQSII